jgi:hypothetical protein
METVSLTKHDWTHKEVTIKYTRKLSEYYIFIIKPTPDPLIIPNYGFNTPLLVKDKIFDERLKTYFLKDAHRVTREEILEVKWNLFITQGYYIKIVKGEIQKFPMDKDKCYVSYLEIAGPLGSFSSVYKESHNEPIVK